MARTTVIERFGGMYRASSTARRRMAAWRRVSTASSCCSAARKNLREVALFPMNQQALDLLMGAPSDVTPRQLSDLHIRLNLPEK